MIIFNCIGICRLQISTAYTYISDISRILKDNIVMASFLDNTKGLLNTTLCYIENKGRYLMLHRIKKNDDPNKGKWVGIGGKLEKDESIEECMLREVYEETNLTLDNYTYRGCVDFKSDIYPEEIMHLFTAVSSSDLLPSECNEGILSWVDKSSISSLPMWEGDAVFFDLINKNSPFFYLTLNYHGDNLIDYDINYPAT